MENIKEEIENEIRNEVKEEVKDELKNELKDDIKTRMKSEIKEKIENKSNIKNGIDPNKIEIRRPYSPYTQQEEEKNDILKMKKEIKKVVDNIENDTLKMKKMEKAVDNIHINFLSNSIKINILYGLVGGLYTLGITGYVYYILHVEFNIICWCVVACTITMLALLWANCECKRCK